MFASAFPEAVHDYAFMCISKKSSNSASISHQVIFFAFNSDVHIDGSLFARECEISFVAVCCL